MHDYNSTLIHTVWKHSRVSLRICPVDCSGTCGRIPRDFCSPYDLTVLVHARNVQRASKYPDAATCNDSSFTASANAVFCLPACWEGSPTSWSHRTHTCRPLATIQLPLNNLFATAVLARLICPSEQLMHLLPYPAAAP